MVVVGRRASQRRDRRRACASISGPERITASENPAPALLDRRLELSLGVGIALKADIAAGEDGLDLRIAQFLAERLELGHLHLALADIDGAEKRYPDGHSPDHFAFWG